MASTLSAAAVLAPLCYASRSSCRASERKMENGLNSWSLKDTDHFDPSEFYRQQKEIDVALSSAFDDASNLSDFTLSDDESDSVSNNNVKKYTNGVANLRRSNFNSNRLDTSTPIRSKSSASSSPAYYRKKLPNSDYRHNISNVPEEESYFSESESHFKSNNDRTEDEEPLCNRRGENVGDHLSQHCFNKDQISSSLLLENDKLTKQLFSLKGECSNISSSYKALDRKFHKLFEENKVNLDIIEQLQSKVNQLEFNLKEEKQTNENLNKKVHFLQSQVDELEYSVNEHGRSDFVVRTNETHDKMVAILKQRHEKELNQLRGEMEQLAQQLHDKEEEILAKNATIERYKSLASSSDISTSLHRANREEIKRAKEVKKREEFLKSMDEKMISLKEDWQIKLQEDVDKIIHWIDGTAVQDHRAPKDTPNGGGLQVKFTPLQNLCGYLEQFMTERERRLAVLIANFKETKHQLENALQESRMCSSSSNLFNSSDKSQIQEELEKIKQESDVLSKKINKYKRYYLELEKKHRLEIEQLKKEFALELFKQRQNQTQVFQTDR